DTDDDGDKVPDVGDGCPNGKTGWETNLAEDADGDGCHDEEEDPDDDNDGFNDASDECPGTPPGVTVYDGGCSAEQGDNDDDGIQNYLDLCPEVAAADGFDVNFDGCTDDVDNDGIPDDVDQCLGTPAGESTDFYGCGYLTQQDADGDGVVDVNDGCPDTSNLSIRDENPGFAFDDQFGCWAGDEDDDGDGYDNWFDQCPDSLTEQIIFEGGCNFEQQDEDGDGVANGDDACPYTPSGAVIIDGGCSRQQLDANSGDSGMSTGTLVAIIAAVVILIVGGAVVAITIIKRKQDTELEARRAVKRGDMPAPATEVAEEAIEDTAESNFEDDPNYKVDENGCEWWLDDDRKWWYRTPEMDDWVEHTGEL
ncbi:MAG: thrombospondin type 3 repeat-containing protein, partial [Candidatus Thalassarchaeaceae archaeon]|nr:thrombospondin type 3 repeat-containing protein [Candidatus Thalassarchaeaceae archaeon]